MAHSTYKELKKTIINKAKSGMSSKVAPVIAKEMSDNVHIEVYRKYIPIEYHDRRMDDGGLSDEDNIKDYVDEVEEDGSFNLRIRNETKARSSSRLLAPLIEEGESWARSNSYGLYHDRISSYDRMMIYNTEPFTPYYVGRRFIERTRRYAVQNKKSLVDILKKDMNG